MAKKKKQPPVQKPLIISLLFLAMLVALTALISSFPKGGSEGELVGQTGDGVRNGTQTAAIQILPKDGSVPESDAANIGDEDTQPTSVSVASTSDSTPSITELVRSEMFMDKAEPAGDKVNFKIDTFQKLATQPLKFTVLSANGSELTPEFLTTVHGEKMHFYMVHANMKDFIHIIPEYKNGVWNVSARMPVEGTYYAYVMVKPYQEEIKVYAKSLVVRNESGEDVDRATPVAGLTAYEGDKSAALTYEKTEEGRLFTYVLRQGDAPAVTVPHLEAPGFLTLFDQNRPETFISVPATMVSDGVYHFTTSHLALGRYTAFAEFRIANTVYIFPLSFDIGE